MIGIKINVMVIHMDKMNIIAYPSGDFFINPPLNAH